eukprot:UN33636
MTCGSFLSQMGRKVLVLEQHDRLGGCTHTFKLNNKTKEGEFVQCEFDTGTHYVSVSMSDVCSRGGHFMNVITGNLVKLHDLGMVWDSVLFPKDTHAGLKLDQKTYEFEKTSERIVNMIASHFEEKHHKMIKERVNRFFDLLFYSKRKILPLFVTRMLPEFMRGTLEWLFGVEQFFQFGQLTTAYVLNAIFDCDYTQEEIIAHKPLPKGMKEELSEKNKSPCSPEVAKIWRQIKGLLVHPIGDYACQPSDSCVIAHALTATYYMNGASYTTGHTQQISQGAERVIRKAGGQCLTQATVTEIVVENNKVLGVKVKRTGRVKEEPIYIRANQVVNGTGSYNLYHKLLDQKMPIVKEFEKRDFRPSFGHNYLFVCLKGDADEMDILKTNGWYINGYDTDDRFNEYFNTPFKVRPPTVYLGFPCTKDPTWKDRFPGVSNCILISDSKWEWFSKFSHNDTGADYMRAKSEFTNHLLNVLYDKVPATKGRVLWTELGTPVTDAHFLGSYQGGSYGTRCNTDYFSKKSSRFLLHSETTIENLYQTGQDCWFPAVAGAMYGGVLCSFRVAGVGKTLKFCWQLAMKGIRNVQDKYKVNFVDGIQKINNRPCKCLIFF